MKRHLPDILALAAGIAAYALAGLFQRALMPHILGDAGPGGAGSIGTGIAGELRGILIFAALEEAMKALVSLPFLVTGFRMSLRIGICARRDSGKGSGPPRAADEAGGAETGNVSGAAEGYLRARVRRQRRFLGMQRGMVAALAFALAETVAYATTFPQSGILARFGWSIPLHLASSGFALCAMDLFSRRRGGLKQTGERQAALQPADPKPGAPRSGQAGILPALGLALASWMFHAAGNSLVIALPVLATSIWGSIGMLVCSLAVITGVYLPRTLGGLYDDP